MSWLNWQRVRRAVLLASTAPQNTRLRALPRHSALRPKVAFEAMEPRMLLSADSVIITAASTVEISQHDKLAADGGVIVDLKLNGGALVTYGDATHGINSLDITG